MAITNALKILNQVGDYSSLLQEIVLVELGTQSNTSLTNNCNAEITKLIVYY